MFYTEDLKLDISARAPRYNRHEIPKGNIRQKLKRNCQGPILQFLEPPFQEQEKWRQEFIKEVSLESCSCVVSLIHCQGEVGSTSLLLKRSSHCFGPTAAPVYPFLCGFILLLSLRLNCDLKMVLPHPGSLDHFIFCSLVPATSPRPSSRSL